MYLYLFIYLYDYESFSLLFMREGFIKQPYC